MTALNPVDAMTNDYRDCLADLLRELDHATHYDYQRELKNRARALLDQQEPQPPADGEVAELVRWLRAHADEHTEEPDGPYTRAADLLQRLASDNAGLEAAAESSYLDNLSLLDSQDD